MVHLGHDVIAHADEGFAMNEKVAGRISVLLERRKTGDRSVDEELFRLVYPTLQKMAAGALKRQEPGAVIGASTLVQEACAKFASKGLPATNDREHLLGLFGCAMRHVLVDTIRKMGRERRGGQHQHVLLDTSQCGVIDKNAEILEIHEALERLLLLDRHQHDIVEMRVFAGMELKEIAAVFGITEVEVSRELSMAKRTLRSILSAQPGKAP